MATSTVVQQTFGFNAPAEVVFGVITDPDRATRWLPRGVTAEPAGDRLRVRAPHGTTEFDVEVIPDRLEVHWRAAGDATLHGSARVSDAPAGGSELHAEVTVPAAGAEERVRRVLDETAGHLRRDVSDNFTAG